VLSLFLSLWEFVWRLCTSDTCPTHFALEATDGPIGEKCTHSLAAVHSFVGHAFAFRFFVFVVDRIVGRNGCAFWCTFDGHVREVRPS
jgi:hypothetical protein